jgi:hypothetical protein
VLFEGFDVLISKLKKNSRKKNHFDAFSIKKHTAPHYQTHVGLGVW